MFCEECQKRKVKEIIAESKKAMKRYTAKLREENNVIQRSINKR